MKSLPDLVIMESAVLLKQESGFFKIILENILKLLKEVQLLQKVAQLHVIFINVFFTSGRERIFVLIYRWK